MSQKVREYLPVALFFVSMVIIFVAGIRFYPKKAGITGVSTEIHAHKSDAEYGHLAHHNGNEPDSGVQRKVSSEPDPADEMGAEAAAALAAAAHHGGSLEHSTPEERALLALAEAHSEASIDDGTCRRVEFRGDGVKKTEVKNSDWNKAVDQFQHAKEVLRKWLKTNRKSVSEKTAILMENQIQDLQLVAPSSIEDPDLSWRGIGVWSRDKKNRPNVQLSPGFYQLVQKNPGRSQFEISRLVAQTWAPCELTRLGGDPIWDGLLECLNVLEDHACDAGGYSEGGWAASSTIAVLVSPPGCTLPVFKNPKRNECLKHIFKSPKKEAATLGKKETKS